MSDDLRDAPIDDGSDKPTGFVSPDGELEVRDSVDLTGEPFHGYHETELGQHQRWMRQAPDLFALYMNTLAVQQQDAATRERLQAERGELLRQLFIKESQRAEAVAKADQDAGAIQRLTEENERLKAQLAAVERILAPLRKQEVADQLAALQASPSPRNREHP